MWKLGGSSNPARIVADGFPESLADAIAARTRTALIGDEHGKKSAVLMPMFEHEGEVHVWLLRRAEGLRRHGGQVAFPGGRFEPEDLTTDMTALREAEEEIALPRASVKLLGALDDLATRTGYVVTPWAAWLTAPLAPRPNPEEVARVFSAPLSTFVPKPRGIFPRIGWYVEQELVWGVTFMLLTALVDVVKKTPSFVARS